MKNKNKLGIILSLFLCTIISVNIFFMGYYPNATFIQQNSSFSGQKNEPTRILKTQTDLELWYTTWGGAAWDEGYGIALDSAGNIYATGSTSSYGTGSRDLALVKFYSSGTKAWNVTWGGAEWEEGHGIVLDSTGNIYVTGETESYGSGVDDLVVIKFYPNGTKAWNVTWGDSSHDYGYDIALDSEGNIYVTGSTYSYGVGHSDIVVVKFYPNGTMRWNVTWGGSSYDEGYGIALDSAGNIYATGNTSSYGAGHGDIAVVKFYPNGTKAWNVTWGGSNDDLGYAITADSAGNIYATGASSSYGEGSNDLAVVKFYPNGTKAWNVTWGGSYAECGYDIALDTAGNIYATGGSSSYGEGSNDLAVVKFYPNGTKSWNKTWGSSSYEIGYGIALDSDGNIYTTGAAMGYGEGSGDLVVVKLYEDSSTTAPIPSFLVIFVIMGLLMVIVNIKRKRKLIKIY
ncbi:MAG: hypothetical protein EU548_00930 [Promethearchaeota archaeon]|nr:MAG: hypothetical protein EU548_00930 [Candidatus Lokiarchaeota archaeon]